MKEKRRKEEARSLASPKKAALYSSTDQIEKKGEEIFELVKKKKGTNPQNNRGTEAKKRGIQTFHSTPKACLSIHGLFLPSLPSLSQPVLPLSFPFPSRSLTNSCFAPLLNSR
jgi:hypothetical protein